MSERIDDLTIDWYDENGIQVVQEVKKEVLTRGAWTTILYAYQDLNRNTDEFGPIKFRVVRYQKRGGRFRPQSKFNISSVKQATQIRDALDEWIQEFGS
ncbi:MAG: hypothetical protein ACQES5_05990 [Thermodesulfobacteriota bacterium]